MKRSISFAACGRTLAIVLALPLAAGRIEAQAQPKQVTLPTRAGQTALPKDALVRDVTIGAATDAPALPLADLIVKDSYLDEYSGMQGVNFLVANVGKEDAGPFEVGISFIYSGSEGAGRWDVYKVDGLKVGESKWVSAAPICCGWTPTEFVVNNSVRFEVVADPKYTKADPMDPYNPSKYYEVKSKIPESNKANNRLVIEKAAMRKGKFAQTNQKSIAAPLGTAKAQPPVIRH